MYFYLENGGGPRNPNVDILTYSEVENVSEHVGNFKVKVIVKPRFMKDAYNVCGDYAKVRPVEVPNEVDEYLGTRKAIYTVFPSSSTDLYDRHREPCSML